MTWAGDPYKPPAARLLVGMTRRSASPVSAYLQEQGFAAMVSANSLWVPEARLRGGEIRPGYFRPSTYEGALIPAALDSAGYVAMRAGGYRWTPEQYVEMVFQGTAQATRGDFVWTWLWWASMDYCVEPQLAHSRARVEERIERTAETLGEILDLVDAWRAGRHGFVGQWIGTVVPDPVPVIQGWLPGDYERSAELTAQVLASRSRPWPPLVGVGSVCRRHLRGPGGLLQVLPAVAAAVPAFEAGEPDLRWAFHGQWPWREEATSDWPTRWPVGLHLFGIKGGLVPALGALIPGRIASVDSMAWAVAARHEAGQLRQGGRREVTADYRLKVAHLDRWVQRQLATGAFAGARSEGD